MPNHDIAKLNEIYSKAESCDKELFSEMRSNLLLVSGEHYKRTSSKLWGRIKDVQGHDSAKLRLVKNHIQKISKTYVNNIVSHAPGVKVVPHNENELSDQKAAELSDSVWQDAKRRHNLREKINSWAENFVDLGEVACKIFWDPMKGSLKAYKQAVNDEGAPLFKTASGEATVEAVDMFTGQQNEPMPDKKQPVFEGDFVFETILAFNLLRAPQTESMEESPYLIYRKMVPTDIAKKMIGDDEDKLKALTESAESTFKVFDGQKSDFIEAKDQVMFREYYFRPSPMYPKGYFYIATDTVILFEGELPFGIFPIAYRGFNKIPTSPRARSIIKVLRPYQAEINRAASAIATTQITLGDDKLVVQAGSKVTKGAELPGVRVLHYSGTPPTVVGGRSGEQYLGYLATQIDEMYKVANVLEDSEEIQGQVDPYALLYRSLRDKKRFSLYVEKFESFLKDVASIYLQLARHYFDESRIIRAVGRREAINIAEFKNVQDMDYQIQLEPMTDDAQTLMGKQIQLNHLIQYVGNQLPPETLGKIVRVMPFLNKEQILDDLTLDDDNITNDILALDRGEYRPAMKDDNHTLYIRRLKNRTKQSDFKHLDQGIQELFWKLIGEHEQLEAEKQRALAEAQAGFIPTGGGLAKADLYEDDPTSPGKQRRALFPIESLMWLKKRLEDQGLAQQQLQIMNDQSQLEIMQQIQSGMINQPDSGQPSVVPMQPMSPYGPASPEGGLQ